MYVCVCVCACMRACVRACVRVCVCVCVCVCVSHAHITVKELQKVVIRRKVIRHQLEVDHVTSDVRGNVVETIIVAATTVFLWRGFNKLEMKRK